MSPTDWVYFYFWHTNSDPLGSLERPVPFEIFDHSDWFLIIALHWLLIKWEREAGLLYLPAFSKTPLFGFRHTGRNASRSRFWLCLSLQSFLTIVTQTKLVKPRRKQPLKRKPDWAPCFLKYLNQAFQSQQPHSGSSGGETASNRRNQNHPEQDSFLLSQIPLTWQTAKPPCSSHLIAAVATNEWNNRPRVSQNANTQFKPIESFLMAPFHSAATFNDS